MSAERYPAKVVTKYTARYYTTMVYDQYGGIISKRTMRRRSAGGFKADEKGEVYDDLADEFEEQSLAEEIDLAASMGISQELRNIEELHEGRPVDEEKA